MWLLGYPQGATLGRLTLTAQAQLRCLKMDISVFVSQPGEARQKAPHLHMRDLCQNWLRAESSCCSPPVPLHEAAVALASSSGAYRITQNLFCSFNALKPLLRSRPPKDRDNPCHKEHADDVPEGIKHIKRNRWVKQVGRIWPEKKKFYISVDPFSKHGGRCPDGSVLPTLFSLLGEGKHGQASAYASLTGSCSWATRDVGLTACSAQFLSFKQGALPSSALRPLTLCTCMHVSCC